VEPRGDVDLEDAGPCRGGGEGEAEERVSGWGSHGAFREDDGGRQIGKQRTSPVMRLDGRGSSTGGTAGVGEASAPSALCLFCPGSSTSSSSSSSTSPAAAAPSAATSPSMAASSSRTSANPLCVRDRCEGEAWGRGVREPHGRSKKQGGENERKRCVKIKGHNQGQWSRSTR